MGSIGDTNRGRKSCDIRCLRGGQTRISQGAESNQARIFFTINPVKETAGFNVEYILILQTNNNCVKKGLIRNFTESIFDISPHR